GGTAGKPVRCNEPFGLLDPRHSECRIQNAEANECIDADRICIPHSEFRITSLHTLRRFVGRQPLCGMGVTSRMDFTSIPTVCSARIADSRPDPGPLTLTSTERRPCV